MQVQGTAGKLMELHALNNLWGPWVTSGNCMDCMQASVTACKLLELYALVMELIASSCNALEPLATLGILG